MHSLYPMPPRSNREVLVEGATRCLQTKGYARTTARDIAAASGANLASIGYHFGSKEGLLNEAIARIDAEWTRSIIDAALAVAGAPPLEQMGRSWVAMLDSFERQRPLLVALVEAMAQVERSDDLRAQMAAHYRELRATVADSVSSSLGPDAAAASGADPRAVASFLIAVCDGFVWQWLLDPEETPSGEQLVTALGTALASALPSPDPAA
jgi:AcrR family transcriptional regulator